MTAAEQHACDCDPATICTEHRQMPDLDGYRTHFDAPVASIDLDAIRARLADLPGKTWWYAPGIDGARQDVADLLAEVERLEALTQAAEYVPAIDFDGDQIGMLDGESWFAIGDTETPEGWEPLYRRVPAAEPEAELCEPVTLFSLDKPCDGPPWVAIWMCFSDPARDSDVYGCEQHIRAYAERINSVAGGVRVTAQAVTA